MPGKQPYLPRPEVNEQAIIEEMIRNPDSKDWDECRKFVMRRVYTKAKNIPRESQEDIIQEIMYKVTKYLPHFHFKCAFTTWLYPIIERSIIDKYRELRQEETVHFPLADSFDENDCENEELNKAAAVKSAEETFQQNQEIRNGTLALLEYANTHSHSDRNRRIIRMVILEGHTHVETAIAVGCNAAVVGYVVRQAQQYVREKMR